MLEFIRDGGALYDLLQAGGIDVMLDLDTVRFAVFVDQPEPAADAFVEFDVLAELLELLATEGDVVLLRFVEHQLHVGQDIAGILAAGDVVTLGPELLRSLSYGLDESEFLHIARRQRAVEVVDKRDDGFPSHYSMSDFTIYTAIPPHYFR